MFRVVFTLGLAVVIVGCAPPRPWERELHADPAMTFGEEALADEPVDHVLEYRESAGGSRTMGGGGCGCN
ncbi:MAG: DUF4266 domain-containing protein [Myxococcota bacterium]